ncbi:hypothetical protein [Glaciihabitans sp. UYNi722]|uniref:hypothetical protein n=1 Tax=Glaciihabitans sp. UYNi722 TaxID=3156344 RepID=UPI003398D687
MASRIPWWDRLNRALFPYIGPPPLGPFNQAPLPSTQAKPCPMCGRPMSAHDIERREGRPTQIHCPAATGYEFDEAI